MLANKIEIELRFDFQKETKNIPSNSGHFPLNCECLPRTSYTFPFAILSSISSCWHCLYSRSKKKVKRREEKLFKTKQTRFYTGARVHECWETSDLVFYLNTKCARVRARNNIRAIFNASLQNRMTTDHTVAVPVHCTIQTFWKWKLKLVSCVVLYWIGFIAIFFSFHLISVLYALFTL